MKFTNRKIKFRVWTGAKMEYKVLAGALGHFYVEGMSETDSACLSEANTIYNKSTPLMQWTGLVDKNGVEIYEGDIIKFNPEREEKLYIVDFWPQFGTVAKHIKDNCDYYQFYCFPAFQWDTYKGNDYEYEVIGNIHQNAELLNA